MHSNIFIYVTLFKECVFHIITYEAFITPSLDSKTFDILFNIIEYIKM